MKSIVGGLLLVVIATMAPRAASAQSFLFGYMLGTASGGSSGAEVPAVNGSGFPCAALETLDDYYACRLPGMWNEVMQHGSFCGRTDNEAIKRACDLKGRATLEWRIIEQAKAAARRATGGG